MKNELSDSILVVDDDPYVLETITTLLEEYGYTVTSCSNGETALKLLSGNDPKLVLSDIKMPGISGIELLEKTHNVSPKMPVILMTGYAELKLALDAIKTGAFDFILKPYDAEHLIHIIKKAERHTELLRLEEDYKQQLENTVKKQTKEIFTLSREVIMRLTAVAEFRDVETGAHISRIGLYANKMCEELGMTFDFTEALTYASSLHDIGKIGIADNILLKPGTFTSEEFEIMKSHTTIGNNILSDSSHPTIKLAASVALNHHERWDGTGYPRGLKGKDIPIEGRILIICDQYDALMSKRPYKPRHDHELVFKAITEGDGRTMPCHFDPDVLQAFKNISPVFKDIWANNMDEFN